MHTYLLSDEDVRRYARDFIGRLEAMGDARPKVWLALGKSGDRMVQELRDAAGEVCPGLLDGLRAANIGCDRKTGRVFNRDGGEDLPHFGSEMGRALIVDSAVHSGKSMRLTTEALWRQGIKDVVSYTLTLKRTSEYIPSFFSLLIGEHDRAYFHLKSLPNNRLNDDRSIAKGHPFGCLRAHNEQDVFKPKQNLECEIASFSKVTLGDLWYEVRAHGQRVYIYDVQGEVVGFVSVNINHGRLQIDLVARDKVTKDHNVGGQLLRWAETYARASHCYAIELWGHDGAVKRYEEIEYQKVLGDAPLTTAAGETYHKMQKRILYNIKPEGWLSADAGAHWD